MNLSRHGKLVHSALIIDKKPHDTVNLEKRFEESGVTSSFNDPRLLAQFERSIEIHVLALVSSSKPSTILLGAFLMDSYRILFLSGLLGKYNF